MFNVNNEGVLDLTDLSDITQDVLPSKVSQGCDSVSKASSYEFNVNSFSVTDEMITMILTVAENTLTFTQLATENQDM